MACRSASRRRSPSCPTRTRMPAVQGLPVAHAFARGRRGRPVPARACRCAGVVPDAGGLARRGPRRRHFRGWRQRLAKPACCRSLTPVRRSPAFRLFTSRRATRCAAAQKAIPAWCPRCSRSSSCCTPRGRSTSTRCTAVQGRTERDAGRIGLGPPPRLHRGRYPGRRDNVPLNLAKEAAFGAKTPLVYSVEEMNQSTGRWRIF